MTKPQIASKIRDILYYSTERSQKTGEFDFATNYCDMVNQLTELLLDIINAPKNVK